MQLLWNPAKLSEFLSENGEKKQAPQIRCLSEHESLT